MLGGNNNGRVKLTHYRVEGRGIGPRRMKLPKLI